MLLLLALLLFVSLTAARKLSDADITAIEAANLRRDESLRQMDVLQQQQAVNMQALVDGPFRGIRSDSRAFHSVATANQPRTAKTHSDWRKAEERASKRDNTKRLTDIVYQYRSGPNAQRESNWDGLYFR